MFRYVPKSGVTTPDQHTIALRGMVEKWPASPNWFCRRCGDYARIEPQGTGWACVLCDVDTAAADRDKHFTQSEQAEPVQLSLAFAV
jgi:hypothetical protein